MIHFNLVDSSFSHHTSVGLPDYSVAGRDSKFINWVRNTPSNNITFFTNEKCLVHSNIEQNKKFGFLYESQAIIPHVYQNVKSKIEDFEMFFTHCSSFLKEYKNCYWIPGGGVWIGGKYGNGEVIIGEKTKLCSFVTSKKQFCELHKFRLTLLDIVKNYDIDVFGLNSWVDISSTLENYMFSIVVENYIDDLYFTEKILNCFATGTIPIYYGAKKISKIFNEKGILSFSNKNELKDILSSINSTVYYEKLDYIKDNFEIAKNYQSIEDYIFLNYLDGKF